MRSASDEMMSEGPGLSASILNQIGHVEPVVHNWEDHYRFATESADVFLIKTHRPPRDEQPAIYVVRDGRSAYVSYVRFHRDFTPQPQPSLLDLVLGDDFYGGWSEHYRAWVERENTLLVRYEDLVNAPRDLLQGLATIVRYSGEPSAWENPFAKLQQEEPRFFRKGDVTWKGDPSWTSVIDAVFFYIHGAAMAELGYASPETVAAAIREVPDEWLELVAASRRFLAGKKALQEICDARQAVIEGLKLACDERLALIEKLSKTAN